MHQDISRCIAAGEFSVYYQPRFSVRTGVCVSAEALVRWVTRPESLPDLFISGMERNGCIGVITKFVIETVCRDIGALNEITGACPKISINIAPALFLDELFVIKLQDIISSQGIKPHQVELEITESSVLTDFDAVIRSAATLRAAGFELALDDFGTGLSSLHYLDMVPASVVKIDRHFISGIGVRRTSDYIVASIARLARDMGMLSVAEGVENPAQLSFVTDHGCDEVQGFLLARPMPFGDFMKFIMAEQPRQQFALVNTVGV